jgi:hypothetical protein
MPTNIRIETLTVEVFNLQVTYHAILRRPCYSKFMVVPNYTYLKLKMLEPAGTITDGTTTQRAYECEVECCDLAKKIATAREPSKELKTISEQAPDAKRVSMTFKVADVVKGVSLDPVQPNGWMPL